MTTARYRPLDLLRDPERWGHATPGDWRPPTSVEDAARIVASTEHERLARSIRERLTAEGHSVPELAGVLGVGYRQLVAKLNGEVALRAEEFIEWQWMLGEHRGLRIPKADDALSNFARGQLNKLTGWRWPF